MDFPLNSNVKDLSESVERDSIEENDCSSVLRYINQVLMEDDDFEDKQFMIQDSTLHAAEKSLLKILNHEYPSFSHQHTSHEDTGSSSDDSITHTSADHTFPTNPLFVPRNFCHTMPNFPIADGGILDYEANRLTFCNPKEMILEVVEMDEGDLQESLLRERISLHRGENDVENEMRSNKHFVTYPQESILHEMFAKVLNLYDGNKANTDSQQNEIKKVSNIDLAFTRKRVTKRKAVDMRGLLIQCMESMANNDHISAVNLLKQIRLRSSPSGNGSERLAHYFAKALRHACWALEAYKPMF